jgi:hypothetical protein
LVLKEQLDLIWRDVDDDDLRLKVKQRKKRDVIRSEQLLKICLDEENMEIEEFLTKITLVIVLKSRND